MDTGEADHEAVKEVLNDVYKDALTKSQEPEPVIPTDEKPQEEEPVKDSPEEPHEEVVNEPEPSLSENQN